MKVSPNHNSINLTKDKKYPVIRDFGFGDVEIKNDVGEIIAVCTKASAWTFYKSWKVFDK